MANRYFHNTGVNLNLLAELALQQEKNKAARELAPWQAAGAVAGTVGDIYRSKKGYELGQQQIAAEEAKRRETGQFGLLKEGLVPEGTKMKLFGADVVAPGPEDRTKQYAPGMGQYWVPGKQAGMFRRAYDIIDKQGKKIETIYGTEEVPENIVRSASASQDLGWAKLSEDQERRAEEILKDKYQTETLRKYGRGYTKTFGEWLQEYGLTDAYASSPVEALRTYRKKPYTPKLPGGGENPNKAK